MLNKQGIRELAYIVKIDEIEPITGSDNCEAAVVGGWKVMVRKNTFKPGDLAIYFEIDSQVPASDTFAFLAAKHYKVKSQRYTFGGKGNFISQGLLMHPTDFGWSYNQDKDGQLCIHNTEKNVFYPVGTFLTEELKVKYADPADNKRKAPSADKYKRMAQRNPKLFKKRPIRWLMKRNWGKKLLFLLFGKKRDVRSAWPAWVVKTDEERIQNLVDRIPEFVQEEWIATEKIDGTSTTFTMRKNLKKKFFSSKDTEGILVCSRNVCFDKPDKQCFYETNVYTEMAEKYHMEDVLKDLLRESNDDVIFITIQGETYGGEIQKRDYSTSEHYLACFNLIFGFSDGTTERANPEQMKLILTKYGLECVPIIGRVTLPDTCDGILALAGGASKVDGLPREGLVFRSLDGRKSFKAVDNNFLLQYH